MAVLETAGSLLEKGREALKLEQLLPILRWGKSYQRSWLSGDVMAGLIVAVMLVPQGMAYALLAGLPPQVGLYASILPLILYGILGTSRVLAVGPVAIVSILVAAGVAPLAAAGTAEYVQLAITLAFMTGIIQAVMGIFRIGFLVNFLSHPVLAGFTSAAALVIGLSQLSQFLGVDIPRLSFFGTAAYAASHVGETNLATLAIGLVGLAILLYFKYPLGDRLRRWGVPRNLIVPIAKSGPLLVVILGTVAVILFNLNETAGVKVVGAVPSGMPPLTFPSMDRQLWQALLPTALAISFVSFMESISVAKSLACKKREKVDSDQELIALGFANLGATLTGGYPVTGGFSRTVVNYEAGANSGLASLITAMLIAMTVLFLTPLFYFLPKAALATIIMVAVIGLVDVKTLRHVWRYDKADAMSMLVTFAAVLLIGIEKGILVGAGTALVLFIWRTSKPHVAVVGRLGNSEIYRNVKRFTVQTCAHAVAVRVDESLFFANAKYLEDTLLRMVADDPKLEHLVLIGTAVNYIDASALETLESLQRQLSDAGVAFHLAAVKGPVLDRLKDIGFVKHFDAQHIHLSTYDAMKAIGCVSAS